MTIEKLISDLPIKEMTCLDPYAGDGRWETWRLNGFKDLHCWEINPDNYEGLKRRLPAAKISIADSYKYAKLPEYRNRFDVVALDNHAGSFGEHCEHFDFLPFVSDLLRVEGGYVIMNVITEPIAYLIWHWIRNWRAYGENTRTYHRKLGDGTFKRWLHGRFLFYGSWEIDKRLAEKTYVAFFHQHGLNPVDFKWAERRPWLYFLRVRLERA